MGGGFQGQSSGGNFGGSVNYPSYAKQPLPWMAQPQNPPPFSAGLGGAPQMNGQGPVGGIQVFPKQSSGSQTFGGGRQVSGPQPVGGIPVFPKQSFGSQTFGSGQQFSGQQPVGGIQVFPKQSFGSQSFGVGQGFSGNRFSGQQPVGGIPVMQQPFGSPGKPFFGAQPISSGMQMRPIMMNQHPVGMHSGMQMRPAMKPIMLGQPNVGVSSLGKAFIPVIQNNPQLSKMFNSGGYLQFNPLSGRQPVSMNDMGMMNPMNWGTGMGMGTGMVGGMGMGHGSGMMQGTGVMGNAGTGFMMPAPIMMGSPMQSQSGVGGGLSKVLLPVKFVTSGTSSTSSTTSTTTATTATGSTDSTAPTTTAAPAAPINIIINPFLPPTLPLPPTNAGNPTVTEIPLPRSGWSGSPTPSSVLNSVFQNRGAGSSAQGGNTFDFSQFSSSNSSGRNARRCTAQRGNQRVTMPLVQESGNALTARKCNALGQLINSFVFVYVESFEGQANGSCVIQVPEIQVTCNTGSGSNSK
ncbi:uncharacterized protein [Littorina saxatilis]|uniref:uncharacterized protein n=1 Tax=Littorina saxatilis TaxID=31220 RepID=UPI0038B534FB